MDVEILNRVVHYLWKKPQGSSVVGMLNDLRKEGIDIPSIAELEGELRSRNIIIISGVKAKVYNLSHSARTELQKMNPKNQNAMYEHLIRNDKGQSFNRLDSPIIHNVTTTPKIKDNTISWYASPICIYFLWPLLVLLIGAYIVHRLGWV